jgi:hypothetical protein
MADFGQKRNPSWNSLLALQERPVKWTLFSSGPRAEQWPVGAHLLRHAPIQGRDRRRAPCHCFEEEIIGGRMRQRQHRPANAVFGRRWDQRPKVKVLLTIFPDNRYG